MSISDQGITTDRYRLIPRVLIFITRGNQVLLLKGSPNKRLWANMFNGIGGHIEPGEDIISAARRELLEETGIDLEASTEVGKKNIGLWMCGTVIVETSRNPGICIFIFTGEYSEGELSFSSEGSLHWIFFDDLVNLPVVEDLPVLIDRILGMKRGDSPFSAKSFYEEGKLKIRFSS